MAPPTHVHMQPREPEHGRARSGARYLADGRRRALRRRARRIRRAVAGGALALFAAAFLAIYAQLAAGHDPALTSGAAGRATVTATSGSPSRSSQTGAAESGSSEEASSPSSLTTSQS